MNGLPLLRPDWPAPASVRAFVTTRDMPGNSRPPYDAFNLGLRSGEDEAVVRANRDLLTRAFGLPAMPHWLRQVHGRDVAVFDASSDAAEERPADAAITRSAGVVLAILTADCMPVLLCAANGSEVAAVHAGWRGLAGGAIEACIGSMQTRPANLLAWLGPAIGAASYEVGDEVREAFVACDRAADVAFVTTRPGHWRCDLYTLARRRLAALGVGAVYGGGFDVFTDARFYSYRRDGARSGRFAALIHIAAV
jgi:YfiH family protein